MFEDRDRLSRLTLAYKHAQERGDGAPPVVSDRDVIEALWSAVTSSDTYRELGLPGAGAVTAEDALAGLRLLRTERQGLDFIERDLIEAAKDHGVTWEQLGERVGVSAQAMQQRYKRLGGKKTWPTSTPRKPASTAETATDTTSVPGAPKG
jgi:hypothetical protein